MKAGANPNLAALILRALAEGPLGRDDLNQRLSQMPGALFGILTEIERKGLIRTQRDGPAGKSRRFRLTPAGLRELSRTLVEHR